MRAEGSGRAFLVRTADRDDVGQILDLFEAVAAEGRWMGAEAPIDRGARLELLNATIDGNPRATAYVAVADGAVIGQLYIELKPSNVAELGMFVARAWRRRGVGSALVEASLDWARSMGAHKVALQVWPHNHAARALYRKFGFVEEGLLRRHYRRRNGELWDAVVMGLVLDEGAPGCSLR